MTPHFEELASIPTPCSNISSASVLVVGTDAFVAYETASEANEIVALVRFAVCWRVVTGGPNDEALHNHRFFKYGLGYYAVQLLADSPWVSEVLTERHKDRTPSRDVVVKHFVISLKEAAVDVLANNIEFVGMYTSHQAAMKVAYERM